MEIVKPVSSGASFAKRQTTTRAGAVVNESAVLPSPAAQPSLAKWHSMIEANDFSDLPSIIAADAVFRSPVPNVRLTRIQLYPVRSSFARAGFFSRTAGKLIRRACFKRKEEGVGHFPF
jgi:hypothetical protein